jgi:hypothetical protein
MPIEVRKETVEVVETEVTWRLQGDFVDAQGNIILDPTIEVYRGTIKRIGDLLVFTPNLTPLHVKASELGNLAPFATIPVALKQMIPNPASLELHLRTLPIVVSMTGDAMARKKMADEEAS